MKKFDVAPKKNTTFTFYYDGMPISARIQDKQFLDKILKGEKFGNGDSLVVDLEVSKNYDDNYDTYIVNKYSILKVKEIQRRGECPPQTKLFS